MIRIPLLAACLAAALPIASARADTTVALALPEAVFANTPIGTWRVSITTFNCQTAIPNPPFESLLSFGIEGNESETTNNPMLQPGQRTPAFGTWRLTGARRATLTTEAFILFSSRSGPIKQGSQTVRHDIRLISEHSFADTATIVYRDTGGHVILTGCATAVGQRL